ncbi:MAG: peptidylprolyl isomerase [Deltaproteobacteria bacterium]|nr:peptidylprolyl isomerase [Deltaproteobacteria bacterium]
MLTHIILTITLFYAGDGVLVDRIAARIENEVIMLSDLSHKVEIMTGNKVDYNETDPKVSKFYRNVLNELIEDKIIQMELKKMGQDVTESELKATIDDIRKQRGFSEDDFIKLLSKEGLSFEQYREEMRRQVRKNKFMAIRIRQRVKITDEDAKLFYNQEFTAKKLNKSYDVSMIFISSLKPKSQESNPEEKIAELKKELLEKKDFTELARKYSDDPSASSGGHLGVVTKGDLRDELEKNIFGLGEGEISQILKFPEGYYVFKVNKLVDADIKGFDEAKEDIKRMLFEKEMLRQYSYVMDSLRKKYTIYINLK